MLLWFVSQLVALAAHPIAFGVLLLAAASLGGWQNAARRNPDNSTDYTTANRSPNKDQGLADGPSRRTPAHRRRFEPGPNKNQGLADGTIRPISAVLAAMLAFSGLVDLRLAGVVVTGAALGSVIVSWQVERQLAKALNRAGELVLAWLIVGIPACAAAALAQETVSGAVVLVCVVFTYDTGASIWGGVGVDPLKVLTKTLRNSAKFLRRKSRRSESESIRQELRRLAGIFAGLTGACAMIFAITAVSLPPYAPEDALKLMIVAVVTLLLGQSLTARYQMARSRKAGQQAPQNLLLSPLISNWPLCRLGGLFAIAPAWLWAIDLIRF